MMRALALMLAVLLAGCSSANIRRDLDVSGSLPRAIGLGAFTPACVFLCFPTATTTQGDTVREEVEEGEPFAVHETRTQEFKGNAAGGKPKAKPRARIAAKPAPSAAAAPAAAP